MSRIQKKWVRELKAEMVNNNKWGNQQYNI